MRTRVLAVDPVTPDPRVLDEAADLLREGRLVAFPTETVYGLGANALDAVAVARIFEAKGRPSHNPVIVHVSSVEQAQGLAQFWPEQAGRLAQAFWPGPLTLVVNRGNLTPDAVTAGGPTVGLRMPSHPVALALVEAAGVPIAAPSANRSLAVSPTRAEHVLRGLDGRIDLILDGGPCDRGLESTVVDVTVTPPCILRSGPITTMQIQSVVGEVGVAHETEGTLRSPGQLTRHYAPATPLWVLDPDELREMASQLGSEGVPYGRLCLGDEEGTQVIPMPLDPEGYGRALYAALHELDSRGLSAILVERPPTGPKWQAIHDRLTRASAR